MTLLVIITALLLAYAIANCFDYPKAKSAEKESENLNKTTKR